MCTSAHFEIMGSRGGEFHSTRRLFSQWNLGFTMDWTKTPVKNYSLYLTALWHNNRKLKRKIVNSSSKKQRQKELVERHLHICSTYYVILSIYVSAFLLKTRIQDKIFRKAHVRRHQILVADSISVFEHEKQLKKNLSWINVKSRISKNFQHPITSPYVQLCI